MQSTWVFSKEWVFLPVFVDSAYGGSIFKCALACFYWLDIDIF